jgi:hypothetical protein
VNDTRRSSRSDSRAHCGDETSEKGASHASVAAARRNGVGDAIFTARNFFVFFTGGAESLAGAELTTREEGGWGGWPSVPSAAGG